MTHWSASYIGIPHAEFGYGPDGAHCWGLAVLVYGRELGITLPTYVGCYASLAERREIAALVEGESADPVWSLVAEPRPFDIAVFRMGRYATHVGVVVNETLVLHVQASDQAKIQNFSVAPLKDRLTGLYRHCDTASRVAR
ncbi:MAG: C40 family peptidase [Arenimonas sp.]|nr:C40 family peptidase [Rhizobium sp.]MBW8447264.1 C40 family peptidase [Arenimonas sp.]